MAEQETPNLTKLTPEEVARLDPFGVRKIPASEELKKLLTESKSGEPEVSNPEIIVREQNEWRKVLGGVVEIQPLPSFVTKEVTRNLERLGFELRFIPAIDLDPSGLRKRSVSEFLQELTRRYPNWKSYESLNNKEKSDHAVVRNLREWYWERVREGKVDFPNLPGVWLAVETLEKPTWGKKYPRSLLTDRLGFSDRFNVSWNKATRAIDKTKQSILAEAGLSGRANIRLLEAPEWNLLANREGWGKTNTYEWTNSEFRKFGGSGRLIVGSSDGGGAAEVCGYHPDYAYDEVGFRLAVVFGTRGFGSLLSKKIWLNLRNK